MNLHLGRSTEQAAPRLQRRQHRSHRLPCRGRTQQVFNWRWKYLGHGGFVPEMVEPGRVLQLARNAGTGAVSAAGRMEVAVADGSHVIVDREVDGVAR